MAKQMEFPLGLSKINKDGSETPDPRPMAVPVGFEKPESIQDLIRRLVTDRQIREELDASGNETFDEADDFEIPDDEPISPHEEQFDPMFLIAREQEIRSGTVIDRSPEEKAAAADLIKKVQAEEAASKKSVSEPPSGG